MNHTPGPWRVEDGRIVTGFVDDRIEVYTGEEGREGDLSLIAAAPELLEALRELLPIAEACHEVPPTRANKARAAIAKAQAD